jgi:predicted Na+-dependent transporter
MEIAKTIAPVCLAIIMFGLGLGLTISDFTRVAKKTKRLFRRLYLPGYFTSDYSFSANTNYFTSY